MIRILLTLCLLLTACGGQAAIIAETPAGGRVTVPTLSAAATRPDLVGSTVRVTSALSAAMSNISSASVHRWPADRKLVVEKGGSVNPTTKFTGLTYVTPEMFGGAGDDSTSNNTAFARMSKALYGGGVVEFQPGLTYRVTGSAGNAVATFTSLQGVKLVGAALIKDTTTYGAAEISQLFKFVTCSGVYIDPAMRFQSEVTGVNTKGMEFLKFLQGCSTIRGGGSFTGGIAAYYYQQNSPINEAYITTDIDTNLTTVDTYYPSLHERSGNYGRVVIHATRAWRAWFGFGGGSGITAIVHATDQQGASIISSDSSGVGVHDTTLRFIDLDSENRNPSSYATALQFYNETPTEFRNIRIELDVKNTEAHPFHASFRLNKLNDAGSADSTGRGHILDGLVITGTSDQVNNREHVEMAGAFASPDVVRNISVENFTGNTAVGAAESDSHIQLTLGDALEGIVNLHSVMLGTGQGVGITHSTGRTVMTGCKMYDGTLTTADTSPQAYIGCTIVNGGLQSYTNKVFAGGTTVDGNILAPPNTLTAEASPASPQVAGTIVTIAGNYGTLPLYDYEFWISPPAGGWTLKQAASTDATYTWNTTGLDPGVYRLSVQAQLIGETAELAEKIFEFTVLAP